MAPLTLSQFGCPVLEGRGGEIGLRSFSSIYFVNIEHCYVRYHDGHWGAQRINSPCTDIVRRNSLAICFPTFLLL